MSRVAATVLGIEAVVIALAIPVAVTVGNVPPGVAIPVGLSVSVACVIVAALLRHGRFAYYLGSALQAVAVGLGVVVPTMFLLGGIFTVLWFLALYLGRKVDAAAAGRG